MDKFIQLIVTLMKSRIPWAVIQDDTLKNWTFTRISDDQFSFTKMGDMPHKYGFDTDLLRSDLTSEWFYCQKHNIFHLNECQKCFED